MTALLPRGLDVSTELLPLALEQSFNAVLITDADLGPTGCRIVYCNPAFCRMTGYAQAELIGQTPRLLQGPRTDRAMLARLRAHLEAGQPFLGSAINYRKDGQIYNVEWLISPLRDAAGQVTHFLSIQQDVTALRAAEHRRDLLAAALDAAPTALYISERSGSLVFANRAFERLTGYSAGAALGRTPAELGMGALNRDFYLGLDPAWASAAPLQATFANQRQDGSAYFCTQSITALADASGSYSHYVTVAEDVSAQAELQRRLQSEASRDALTGLLNRRAGEEVLRWCEQAHLTSGAPYALILADIDHFKRINDVWGHPTGDRVLCAVAQHLAAAVRSGDSVVRWGGEEFLIVLPGVGLAGASELAQRMRLGVAALCDREAGSVTLSQGVAESRGSQGSAALLLELADRALYAAKARGRNRVELGLNFALAAAPEAAAAGRWLERGT